MQQKALRVIREKLEGADDAVVGVGVQLRELLVTNQIVTYFLCRGDWSRTAAAACPASAEASRISPLAADRGEKCETRCGV